MSDSTNPTLEDLSKSYYQIGEVAELLDIPPSTLRYWEGRFTIIKPKRGRSGRRFYTKEDIEKIAQIYYLVKEKGLRLEAAQESLKTNPEGIETRYRVLLRLKTIREELSQLLEAVKKMR